jgi:hypothetical protein
MKKFTLFAALLFGGALWPLADIQAATWDLSSDYSFTTNPNGAWSYGWEAALNGPLTLYDTSSGNYGPQWYDSSHHSGDNTPTIWKNTSTVTAYGVAPGQVSLHPGWDNSFSVVRWTSPTAGQININGLFGKGDIGAMSYYIAINGTIISQWLSDSNPTENFSFVRTIAASDIIDFMVGAEFGGGNGFGNTPLEVNISSDVGATPLPAALPLFATGAGMLGLLGWRRKRKAQSVPA